MKQFLLLIILSQASTAHAEVNLIPVPANAMTRAYLTSYATRGIPADLTFVVLLLRQQPTLVPLINSLGIDSNARIITLGVTDPAQLSDSAVFEAVQNYAKDLSISFTVIAQTYRGR